MIRGSLYRRIALAFAAIVLPLGIALAALGYATAKRHQHEVLQRLSLGLAAHIAGGSGFDPQGRLSPQGARALFARLMAVNPNVEVYLLDRDGRVLRASAVASSLPRARVDLAPVDALLAGRRLPILGDNPRHADRRDIFSAAPVHDAQGRIAGYVYIVLLNDMYRAMVAESWLGYAWRSAAALAAVALLAALGVGLWSFARVTRRLRRLTARVDSFARAEPALQTVPGRGGDEIDWLNTAFDAMRERLRRQVAELRRQDELRRELVANVSHDLRTPLTSLHGYLETLVRMEATLPADERRRYLDVAMRQSQRVSRLAQQLFDLARLECEETLPQPELFSIAELVHDISQKYALTAQAHGLDLQARVDPGTLSVRADIGMIERVIGNLLDNAIRHTPRAGRVRLRAFATVDGIEVEVSDTGSGIAGEHMPGLLRRGSPIRLMAARRGGGLGLLIASRMLQMHGSAIQAWSRQGRGTRIRFVLPAAEAA